MIIAAIEGAKEIVIRIPIPTLGEYTADLFNSRLTCLDASQAKKNPEEFAKAMVRLLNRRTLGVRSFEDFLCEIIDDAQDELQKKAQAA